MTLATEQLKAGLRELERAQGAINKTADAADKVGTKAEGAFSKLRRAAAGATDGIGGMTSAVTALAGAFSIASLTRAADDYTKLTAQLRLATKGQEAYNNAFQRTQEIARAAQADVNAIATLYARISRSTEQLGISQAQVGRITETVALALKANGATANEAASAMLQLSQAFGSGVLRGEEFNAVNEAAPNLIAAMADALGVSQGAMRKLAEEGKLTSQVLAITIPSALEKFQEEAKQVQTISGGIANLKTEFTLLVGEFDKLTGASKSISGGLQDIANAASDARPEVAALMKEFAPILIGGTVALGLASIVGLGVRIVASMNPVLRIVTLIGAAAGFLYDKLKGIEQITPEMGGGVKVDLKTQQADIVKQIQLLQETGFLNGQLLEGAAKTSALMALGKQYAEVSKMIAEADKEAVAPKIDLTDKSDKAAKAAAREYAERMRLLGAQNESFDALVEMLDEHDKELLAYEEKTKELERQVEEFGKSEAELRLLSAARLRDAAAAKENAAALEQNSFAAERLRKEAVELRKQADLSDVLAGKETQQDIEQEAKRAAEASRREFDRVTDDIGKGLAQALFSGGKRGTDRLGAYIKNYFQQLVVRVAIEPVLKSIAGSLLGTFGVGGAANAGGLGGDLFSLGSSIKSAFDFVKGGFTSIGNSAFELTTKLADYTSLTVEQTASLASNAATFAQYAGGVLGGLSAGKALSGGYAIGGGSGNSAVNFGTAIGAIFGPLGALAGGALGGLANRAFGRKTVMGASGIQGSFSTEGFSGQAFQDVTQKGGWFRSSKSFTLFSNIASEALDSLSEAMKGATAGFKNSAQVLGIDVRSALAQFRLEGRFSVGSAEQLAATLKQVTDAMVTQAIPALKEFQAQGESLIDTANRVATATAIANQASLSLGKSASFYLMNAEKAMSLVATLGESGLQNLSFFVENFVPEALRADRAVAQFSLSVRQLGLQSKVTADTTREQFRALVEGADLSTEAGQRELAALLQLAPALDAIIQARGDEAVATEGLLDSIQKLIADITRDTTEAIDKQISASKRAGDAARAAATDFKNLAESLRKTGADLFGQATGQTAGSAFANTLRSALSGDRLALAALGGEAGRAFEEIQRNAVSATDVARQSAVMQKQLEQAAKVADVLGVNADYQAKLFDVQTAVLETLREELESGGINEQRLREIIAALGRVQGAIDYSAGLTVDELLGVQGEIIGQTDITQIVASATEGSETLLNAVLNRLSQGDTGSSNIVAQLQRGTMEVTGHLDRLIAAVRQQSEAQAAELKRQRDLQVAQSKLDQLAAARQKAIGEVASASSQIKQLASQFGLGLEANQGDTFFSNTAKFGVNAQGLFESMFNQISYNVGNEGGVRAFKDRFYGAGGLYDQTYGRSGELQNYLTELEAQRQLIRDLGGIPQFAMGGMHSGGLRIVGERGPELEATGPARYWTAGMTAQMMSGGGMSAALAAKMDRLCEEVAGMRQESQMGMYQVAKNTGNVDRRLERWDDGDRCRTMIDQEAGETVNVTVVP
ncbi:MAG TPA: tape measure protein [Limnobacter sp.]|nr:tape measure protein [Limnobacter sp.]